MFYVLATPLHSDKERVFGPVARGTADDLLTQLATSQIYKSVTVTDEKPEGS